MTYADQDFIPNEGQEESPNYPKAFGITFTPKIAGAIVAVLGLLGATYLLINAVQPKWQQVQELERTVEDKANQIQQQKQLQEKIAQKEAELAQAQQKNQQVLSLFASEKTLNTLILDLNSFIKDRRGRLVSYQPSNQKDAQGVVNDGSYGPEVNGKLQRKVIDVEIEGSFEQTQSILRSVERLQTLLLIKNFTTEVVDNQGVLINSEGKSIPAIFKRENQEVVPGGKPDLRTSFQMEVLIPVNEQEAQTAPTAATKPAKK